MLVFTPTLGDGGAERVTTLLLRHLDRRRFSPSLALLRREGVLLEEIPPDIDVHILGSPRLAVALLDLVRTLRRVAPDVVLCMHGGANVVVAAAHLLAQSRARLVLSERSALLRADRSPARLALELPAKAMLYRRADAIAAVSAGVARELERRLRLAPSKIDIVYNPIVDDRLEQLTRIPIGHRWWHEGSAAAPLLLAVGRLVAIKDYPTLLDAFARIRATRRARLAILGDGPLRADIAARIAALGLAEDVELFGFDANPFRFMASAKVMLHASRAEGLPGAIIQAMACGLPVVATDCDFGPREVIRSGHDGFLVPVGNAAALAEHAVRLLDDAALSERISRAARSAAARFSVERVLGSYERALGGAGAASKYS